MSYETGEFANRLDALMPTLGPAGLTRPELIRSAMRLGLEAIERDVDGFAEQIMAPKKAKPGDDRAPCADCGLPAGMHSQSALQFNHPFKVLD